MALKYRIETIGWYSFETLVQTLLKGLIGPGVTSFGGTKDGGRDATFSGRADFPSGQTKWNGHWIFQVKYVELGQGTESARKQLKTTVRKEIEAILARRKPELLFDNYVLITDVPLTGGNRDELMVLVRETGFCGNFRIIDGNEVCEFLDLFPQVRRSYPQLLGLADLDGILNRELYTRSEAYVQYWQPCLVTFVRTEAYEEALATLRHRHFVLLDGPPEAGKSTIAAALALLHATEGYEVIDLRSSEQVFEIYKPETLQIFVADDAVGSVSFNPSLTDTWSRDLPGILRKLDASHLLIWTARSYVLEEAVSESRLGEAIRDFPGTHEVLVEVGKLSPLQKAEILYNHAKQAHLTGTSRELVRENAQKIVEHPSFTPERIRQLVEHVLPNTIGTSKESREIIDWKTIDRFLSDPGPRWAQAYKKLGTSEQTLLSAMLDFDFSVSTERLERAYELHARPLGHSRLSFDECIERVRHSFLRVTKLYTIEHIEFQHPSLRDMLLSQFRDNELVRRRYIELASPLGLSKLIQGVALQSRSEESTEHAIAPRSDEEISILLERLTDMSSGTVPASDWQAVLTAADLLPPREMSRNGSHPALLSRFKALQGKTLTIAGTVFTPHFTAKKLPPTHIDLPKFSRSWAGTVLEGIVHTFRCQETFERNRRYSLSVWTRLLSKYYDLAIYVLPPPTVQYLPDLAKFLKDAAPEDGIEFATLIHGSEPLVIKQTITSQLIASWHTYIENKLEELMDTGEDLSKWSPDKDWKDDTASIKDDYDTWYADAENLVTLARGFYEWTSISIFDDVEVIEELMNTIEPPLESEPESDDDNLRSESAGVYWTIEKMFEDL